MSFKRICAFILLVFLVAAFGYAQITQTGVIRGKVSDDNGQPLPGVTVTAKSPALIIPQLNEITDERGYFRFTALPSGTYTVTFGLTAFKTLIREGILINVGLTTTLNVAMEVTTIAETVLVIGDSPTIDVQRGTVTTTMKAETIRMIPALRGSLDTTFHIVPGAVGRSYSGGSARDNAILIDGMSITHPRSGYILASYNIDLAQEISFKSGSLPAEHGDSRGAVINAVTKSGGNEFHGWLNFYFRNLSMQSDNSQGTPFEGRLSGFHTEYDFSYNFGGPIIKDKLWFFSSLSYIKTNEYKFGYPYDKETDTIHDTLKIFPFNKLTFQLNPSNKIVFSMTHMNFFRHHRNASRFYNEEATVNQTNPAWTVNLRWTGTFGKNFFLNTKVGGVFQDSTYRMKTNVIQTYNLDTRYRSGSYGYDQLYHQPTAQFMTDGTLFVDDWMGTHEFKGGVQINSGWVRINRVHGKDPVTGLGYQLVTDAGGIPLYINHREDYEEKENVRRIGGFIQDSWSPTERLYLNLGLRFDHQEGIIPVQGAERGGVVYQGVTYDPQVTELFKPIIWNNFSPRIGLVYALTSDNKTALKASYSRYQAAVITQWFRNQNPNLAINWRQDLNPDGTVTGDPYRFSSSIASTIDPDLKTPYIDEFIVGIEREIAKDIKLSVRYIRKNDRQIVEDIDINALDPEALKNGELSWLNYQAYTAVDPYNGQTVTFYGVIDRTIPRTWYVTSPPQATRNFDSVEVVLDKRYSNGWQLNASYVYAYSKGLFGTSSGDAGSSTSLFDNPNAHINADGIDGNIPPHQFKLQSYLRGPWGINISGYFFYFAGRAYTRTIQSRNLGLSLPQGNVSIRAEEKGSRNLPALKILDLRFEKSFNLSGIGRLAFNFDVFNVFNSNTATGRESLSSNPLFVTFEEATGIYSPRSVRFGVKFEF